MFGPQEAGLAAAGHHFLKMGAQIAVFGPQVDQTERSADGPRPDGHAVEDQIGELAEDEPVFERARLALVGVADDVLGPPLLGRGQVPLHPGGEARSAASLEPGLAHVLDYVHAGEGEGLVEPLSARHRGEGEVVGDGLDVGRQAHTSLSSCLR